MCLYLVEKKCFYNYFVIYFPFIHHYFEILFFSKFSSEDEDDAPEKRFDLNAIDPRDRYIYFIIFNFNLKIYLKLIILNSDVNNFKLLTSEIRF